MKFGFGTYALMLSIVLWGVLLGGVAYSHIVYFPVYLAHLPESAALTNGPYALHEEHFWLLIHPVLVLSLVISLIANWRDAFRRKMVASTLGLYIAVLVVSSLYFIPQLQEFRESPTSNISTVEWQARGAHWQRMSYIRGGVLSIFSVPLLLALAKPRSTDGAR